MSADIEKLLSMICLAGVVACGQGPDDAAAPKVDRSARALDGNCEGGCTLSSSCDESCWSGLSWETCGWWGVCNNGLSYCHESCDWNVDCGTTCVYVADFNGAEYTTSCGSGWACCNPGDPNCEGGDPSEPPGGSCRELYYSCDNDHGCCSGYCHRRDYYCARPPGGWGASCTWDDDCMQRYYSMICLNGQCEYGTR